MDRIGWLLQTIFTGTLAFVATNIDDLFLLILLFSLTNFRKRHIVAGQYLGFIVIIIVSTLGFLGKWIVPLGWIGFLGLVPIAIGLQESRKLLKGQKLSNTYERNKYIRSSPSPSFAHIALGSLLNPQTYSVAGMTIGNGSDNISTYIPLFATGSFIHMEVLIGLFLLLVGLWCYIGYILVRFPSIASIVEQCGHIILPLVFIVLGIIIIIEAGTFTLVSHLVGLRPFF